uniref:Gap junction protein n=1 Tax=Callorhinchus milii TaxID=7868 RepID=A0A4W3ISD1_CALMI
MGDWSLLGRLLTEVQHHSTAIGKVWLTMLLIFRILLVTLVGDAVYSDEQSKFKCNTLQPGCNNVCYDTFAPISHLRFWVFQIVLVSTPSIFYIVYVLHKIAIDEKNEIKRGFPDTCVPDERFLPEDEALSHRTDTTDSLDTQLELRDSDYEEEQVRSQKETDPTLLSNKVLTIYVVHVMLRSLMEIAFLLGQYYLYGFTVPHLFVCWTSPCPNKVDCFVSRATEKTIFLNFMFYVSLGCLLLNIIELHYLGWVYIARVLCTACSPCCEKKRYKEAVRRYSQRNPLLLELKDSFHANLMLKSSKAPFLVTDSV